MNYRRTIEKTQYPGGWIDEISHGLLVLDNVLLFQGLIKILHQTSQKATSKEVVILI